jgi:hypothetical protein
MNRSRLDLVFSVLEAKWPTHFDLQTFTTTPTYRCDRKLKITRLPGKEADRITSRTLYSAAESQIAFAKLFFTVANEAYKTGERELGDHAQSVAKSACNVLDEILREIDPAAGLSLSADLHGLKQLLKNL